MAKSLCGQQKSRLGQPKAERRGPSLPVVLPFVLSQNPEGWPHSTEISDLFQIPGTAKAVLEPYLPKFRHLLLDLSEIPPGASGAATLEIIFRLMKAARERDALLDFFDWLATSPIVVPKSLLEVILIYALQNQSELDPETIWGKVNANQDLNSNTMNALQKLLNKGREEGIEKGREEGIEKGRKEGELGKIQLLQQLMRVEATAAGELMTKELDELKTIFQELEQAYIRKFKTSE